MKYPELHSRVPHSTRLERHRLARELQSQRDLRNSYISQGMSYRQARGLAKHIASHHVRTVDRTNVSYNFWRCG